MTVETIPIFLLVLIFSVTNGMIPRVQRDLDPLSLPPSQLSLSFQHHLQFRIQYDEDEEGFYYPCAASLVEVDGEQVAITLASCVETIMEHYWSTEISLVGGFEAVDGYNSDHTQARRVVDWASLVNHDDHDHDSSYVCYLYENLYSLGSDIAIVFIDEPFELNEYVTTIELPEPRQETTGSLSFYLYRGDDKIPVDSAVVRDEICEFDWYHPFFSFFKDNLICIEPIREHALLYYMDGVGAQSDCGYLAGIVNKFTYYNIRYSSILIEVSHSVERINHIVADYLENYSLNATYSIGGHKRELASARNNDGIKKD